MADVCVTQIAESLAGKATKEEIEYIVDQLRKFQESPEFTSSAYQAFVSRLRKEQRTRGARIIKERIMDARIKHDTTNAIVNNKRWETAYKDPKKRLEHAAQSIIEGREARGLTAENSVTATRGQVNAQVTAPFQKQLVDLGIHRYVKDESFNLRVARALFDGTDDTAGDALSDMVNQAKRTIQKANETIRTMKNEVGASVFKDEKFITSLKHNGAAISEAGFDAWKNSMLKRLNISETFGYLSKNGKISAADIIKELQEDFNKFSRIASGDFGTAIKGPSGSKLRKLERGRTYKWNSADDRYLYNKEFGSQKNIFATLVDDFDSAAKDIAIMKSLGPNAVTNMRSIVENLGSAWGVDSATVSDAVKAAERSYSILTGRHLEGYGTINEKWAQRAGLVRSIQGMSKLGFSGLTVSLDYATTIMHTKTTSGKNVFSSAITSGVEIIKAAVPGQRKQFAQEALLLMDGFVDELRMTLAEHSAKPGIMTKMVDAFYTVSGLSWLTDVMKRANGNLAIGTFNKLIREGGSNTALKNTMLRYDITPSDIKALRTLGENVTPRTIAESAIEGKQVLLDKYQAFMLDSIHKGSPTPGVRTREALGHAHARGTMSGEARRFMSQFKNTIWKVTTDIGDMARASTDTGALSLTDVNTLANVSQFVLLSTVLGGMRYELGRRIRDNNWDDPVEIDQKFVLESLRMGGGIGIVGDLIAPLFDSDIGTLIRKGALADFAVGPAPVAAWNLTSALIDKAAGATYGDEKLAKEIMSNVPGRNLFYLVFLQHYTEQMLGFDWQPTETLEEGIEAVTP